MSKRQYTRPMVIRNGQASPLHRVPFDDRVIDESRLQQLLFDHPQLLPTGEIEPLFDELIPVARELPTAAGPVDLVYVTADGFLALAETKLWRNPDARRSVVAQIIDYTKEMARWSYTDLIEAIRKVRKRTDLDGDPLTALAAEASEDFDEAAFHDQVSRNLRLGRFLLMIVGDGIREDVEHMADYLQQTPQLGFTLALIEIGLYRLDAKRDDPLFIQPRILARTQEVTRAVVEIRNRVSEQVAVAVSLPAPDEDSNGGGGRTTITEQQFLEALAKNSDAEVVQFVKWVLENADEHQLSIEWGARLLLKYIDEHTGNYFTFAGFTKRSKLTDLSWLGRMCEKLGLPAEIVNEHHSALERLIPGSKRYEDKPFKKGQKKLDVRMGPAANKDRPPLALLAPRKEEWFAAIDKTIERIQEALQEQD